MGKTLVEKHRSSGMQMPHLYLLTKGENHMDELEKLAGYIYRFQLEDAPPSVVRAAKYCVLDTVGAAMGAARCEEIPQTAEEMSLWSKGAPEQSASIWGLGRKSDIFTAALINGLMAHALELDDMHTRSKTHVGSAVIPAAWAVAEATKARGRDFLEAVIVGYETMARVGMGLDAFSHRNRGFHATGLFGTFGAAAAGAKLLGLDVGQIVNALGMAGTQSSGLRAFLAEGSGCKKLHPGRAAANGLTAAVLSKAGMTGPSHILDAEDGGLYRAAADSFDMSAVCRELGRTYEIMNIDKRLYPCCRSTHPAIDAALFLRRAHGAEASQIERITIDTYSLGVLQCGFEHYPTSGADAKFSTAYVTAAAFVCGKVSREQFLPQALKNPLIRQIAGNVSVRENAEFTKRYPHRRGCRMTVKLKNGDIRKKQVDDITGSANAPLNPEQEMDKFMGLLASALEPEKAGMLAQALLAIDELKEMPRVF